MPETLCSFYISQVLEGLQYLQSESTRTDLSMANDLLRNCTQGHKMQQYSDNQESKDPCFGKRVK